MMKQGQLKYRAILAIMILFLLSIVAYGVSQTDTYKNTLYDIQNRNDVHTEEKNIQEALDIAIWMWESPTAMSATEIDQRINLLKEEGISTVYLRIDEIVDIVELKDNQSKEERRKQFDEKLSVFLVKTAAANIKVEGLAGDIDWAETDKDYISFRILNYIAEFNNSQEHKIAGVHFDIEPHGLKVSEAQRNATMVNYLNHVEEIVENMNSNPALSGLDLGFAIPYWYDGESQRGFVEYKRTTSGVVFFMAGILSQKQNSYLVLMDYRNFALGRDGSIAHAQTEVNYFSDKYPEIGIVIGQETTNVEPKKITFFGKTKGELYTELTKINEAFESKKAFQGFAIHEYKSFEKIVLQK